jgi:RNA polymerase sigma-70 factor (ECF subfamily)
LPFRPRSTRPKRIPKQGDPAGTAARSRELNRRRLKPLDDSLLVDELKKGSEEAFVTLFDRFHGRIFNVVFRVLGDAAECEDVVQEVFMKVIRNIDSFNEQSTLYTWLYRIAVNAAVDTRKKFGPRKMASIYDREGKSHEIPSLAEAPDRDPQRREMADLLRDALDQLSEDHKTILVLREFEGLSYNEIAEVLDCSKGTVESRLYRARNRLREKMERFL